MKRTVLPVFLAWVLSAGCHGVSMSEDLTAAGLKNLAEAYKYFFVLGETEDGALRYMYSDAASHIHVYAVKDGRSELEWETATLGSAITAVHISDVTADGRKEIWVSTARGRIIVYDEQNFDRLYENFIEPFQTISCMTTANIDNDAQEEIIVIGDGLLHIFDGRGGAKEWQSTATFAATEILMGNLDDDPQLEIILNSGVIIDSRFYTVEPYSLKSGAFGLRMRLLDMNGDGYPEVFSETTGFALKVYDVYGQRELW
jgi:hypothetical protein